MKEGDKVKTIYGTGIIIHVEEYSRLNNKRFGIELDWYGAKPISTTIVYCWKEEIKPIKKTK